MTTLVYIPLNLPTGALQSRQLGRPRSPGATTELPMLPPGDASVGPPAVDGASDAVQQLVTRQGWKNRIGGQRTCSDHITAGAELSIQLVGRLPHQLAILPHQ